MKTDKAILTAEEDKRWEQLFEIAANSGKSDLDADADAWRGLQEEFPRLREFEGCE